MSNRIVFSDSSYTANFTPKHKSETSIIIQQVAPQSYTIQSAKWNDAEKKWDYGMDKKSFQNPKPKIDSAQQRYSELRKGIYLTMLCTIPLLVTQFFRKHDSVLTLRGMTMPLTERTVANASAVFWAASLLVMMSVTKVLEISSADELTLLEQKLRFSKFKKDASAYAAVVFTITSCIGVYLSNVDGITLGRFVYRITLNQALIFTAGSMIATLLMIKSFDQQTNRCSDHAFDLAVKVISESNTQQADFPDPLIERKNYV